MRISKSKSEQIEYGFGGKYQEVYGTKRVMTTSGDVISEVESLKYILGSFVQRDGDFLMDVKHGSKCGWTKWIEVLGFSM